MELSSEISFSDGQAIKLPGTYEADLYGLRRWGSGRSRRSVLFINRKDWDLLKFFANMGMNRGDVVNLEQKLNRRYHAL